MVPWAAGLVAKILCDGVQALLAQALETVVAMRVSNCETFANGQGCIALCATAICNSAICESRRDPSGCRHRAPIIRIRRGLVDLRGNTSCVHESVVSTVGGMMTAAMAALSRRR